MTEVTKLVRIMGPRQSSEHCLCQAGDDDMVVIEILKFFYWETKLKGNVSIRLRSSTNVECLVKIVREQAVSVHFVWNRT